jgi:UDP-N-acetylglucosamine transferase subunit ALG13
MILILLGTIKLDFKRPLVEVDDLCQQGIINEKIIVQAGFTTYLSKYLEIIPFIDPEIIDDLLSEARLVITHAGSGSVISALKKEKKIISIARYAEYNEHVDNHQLDLLNEFAKSKYIIPWYKEDKLADLIKLVNEFKPNLYISNKKNILEYIRKCIIK